jgi:hypothetical protein
MGLQLGNIRRTGSPDKMMDNVNDWTVTLHNYFGYEEDWVRIPLNDLRGKPWMLIGGDERGASATFVYADEPFTEDVIKSGKCIYGMRVYTQRHLPRWVWRKPKLTMVCVDTQTDGNKFLTVVDTNLECTDEKLKALYTERW